MNIDGKDIEMKPAICYGKVYDKWLVSECGKVWSVTGNKVLSGSIKYNYPKNREKRISSIMHMISVQKEDWWGDGSAERTSGPNRLNFIRDIKLHKMIMDTWKPLYDNPPEGIVWEEWEIVRRDLPSVYNHINKTVCIDHIDDDPTNNHLDNLRRVTIWDNNYVRKTKGI